jgi:putative effector of murein hydrolase
MTTPLGVAERYRQRRSFRRNRIARRAATIVLAPVFVSVIGFSLFVVAREQQWATYCFLEEWVESQLSQTIPYRTIE